MSIGNGLITIGVMSIICAIVSFVKYRKTSKKSQVIYSVIFFVGVYLLCCELLFPIPLNKLGAEFEGCWETDNIGVLFYLIPFSKAPEVIKYMGLTQYLVSFTSLASGAFLLGISWSPMFNIKKIKSLKLILGLFVPLMFFVLYFVVTLITGYVWKYIDISFEIVYLIFFVIGFCINYITTRSSRLQNEIQDSPV